MTVESIKQAIAELGAEEKTSLATWLIEQDAAEWDRQVEEDFSPGGGEWPWWRKQRLTSARA